MKSVSANNRRVSIWQFNTSIVDFSIKIAVINILQLWKLGTSIPNFIQGLLKMQEAMCATTVTNALNLQINLSLCSPIAVLQTHLSFVSPPNRNLSLTPTPSTEGPFVTFATVEKTNATLAFVGCILYHCSRKIKEATNKTYVRPMLEYASDV